MRKGHLVSVHIFIIGGLLQTNSMKSVQYPIIVYYNAYR